MSLLRRHGLMYSSGSGEYDVFPDVSLIETEPLYTNDCGSGNRKAKMYIYDRNGSIATSYATVPDLIDGNTTSANCWFASQAVSGKILFFDFLMQKRIVGIKFYESSNVAQGNWNFQGSNDDLNWTTIANIDLNNGEFLFTNTNYYNYHRMIGVSGNSNSSPYAYEFEFKIMGYIFPTGSINYTNANGSGDRRSTISLTTDLTYNGTFNTLLDGVNNSGTLFFNSQAVSGKYIKFQFPKGKIICGFKFFQSNAASYHGYFDLQGSNDDTNWTTIKSNLLLSGLEQLFTNTTAYYYYRLLGVSGNTSSSPYIYEFEFKIS